MEFPNSYFEDEVRDGFYVPSMMKRAWAAQLEMLEDIDKVCKKYDIRYFADCGTLLGAARHRGFIPWDDDLDIGMFRRDYEKFCEVAPKELEEFYGFLNFEHSDEAEYNCVDYLTRVYSGNRIRVDKAYMDKFHGFPYISGIDIFPIDYMPRKKQDEDHLYECVNVLNIMAQTIYEMNAVEREATLRDVENNFHVKIDRSGLLSKQLYMLADKMCGMYSEQQSDRVGVIIRWTDTKKGIFPKINYKDFVFLPYEVTKLPVPIGYQTLLRMKYGKYYVAKHDGGSHEYPFYQRQIDEYEENHRPLYRTYKFLPEHLKRHHKEENVSIKDIAADMLKLFCDAHEEMIEFVLAGDYAALITLTEDCQDGAIALGTKMEEIKGEGFASVKALEQYCELMYEIHETVLSDGAIDAEKLRASLKDSFACMENSIRENLFKRKEIIFLPFRGAEWKAFDSIYRSAIQDPNADVYVVPIPYYEKDYYGGRGMMHYDLEEYPSDIRVYDYNTFDFGLHHADMMFIQNPYDEYNLAIEVPAFFFSKNLKEYTDMLVYVPFFKIDEIKPTDERAVKSLQHFCLMPGVVHADKVIVQSEQMKETYVKALTDFAGPDTEDIWKEKICGLGSPIDDYKTKPDLDSMIPNEWKTILLNEEGQKKKAILFVTGIGDMMEQGEKILKKIETSLDVFRTQNHIVLIWRPYSETSEALKRVNPAVWGAYQSAVEKYRKEGWGILDESENIEDIIPLCDAYYGEDYLIAHKFSLTDRPAMIYNLNI